MTMGKIKTHHIKTMCEILYDKYEDELTKDYYENREFVREHIDADDYQINRIAGRLVQMKKTNNRKHTYKRKLSRREMIKLRKAKRYSGWK